MEESGWMDLDEAVAYTVTTGQASPGVGAVTGISESDLREVLELRERLTVKHIAAHNAATEDSMTQCPTCGVNNPNHFPVLAGTNTITNCPDTFHRANREPQ
jgi:hypothetical protein